MSKKKWVLHIYDKSLGSNKIKPVEKRSIIFNKNTCYKGSDIRTSAVSKNRRKKHWTSTLFLRLISTRCIFARSTIATLRVVIKINLDLIYYW
jgi:hypothetical protein